MNKRILVVVLLFGMVMVSFAQSPEGSDLLEKAKVRIFDRQWGSALKILDQFLNAFPESKQYPLALFYKGKCLEESKRQPEALAVYRSFLSVSRNDSLSEEATVAIIDIYFDLHRAGKDGYMDKISDFLESNNRTIQYYAAFKLSYADEKSWARKAVPVLKKLLVQEKDDELKDRARIALMRIDPEYVRVLSKEKSSEPRIIHIQVVDRKLKKVTFSLAIPFFLGKLALESIPQKEKSSLKREGYSIEELLKKLVESGDLLKIDDGDSTIKIWIE